ncbi:MAG: SAVED domain-containing protein [Nitrospirota bacterium]|nr:SAVED domain-containing protein [Nitrospirota bacterium]
MQEIAGTSPKIENFKELVDYHKDIKTINPYALAVSLLPTTDSIKGDVERFLRSKGGEWEKMPVEELNMNGLSPETIEDFINTLRVKRRQLEAQDATEIHLFIAGPIQAGTLIGAMFDNWRPVKLYHKNQKGNYEFWCHLIK